MSLEYVDEVKSSKCLSRATALVEVDPQFETRFSTKALFQFWAYYTSPSNETQHLDLEPTRSGGTYHLMGRGHWVYLSVPLIVAPGHGTESLLETV